MAKKLLSVVEFLEHAKLASLYKQLGYEVSTGWQVRKAIALMRKLQPDVIVADFYFQADFRDRLSNLESLLAAAQPMAHTRILVLYEPKHQPVLDKVRSRLRMDATLTMPVKEAELQSVLSAWL
jgi:CheY-like chemotaxis protein